MKEMFEPFSHFLGFGMSDQRSLRNLTAEYDGMIVPGTIAAYQADPTRGFVLSLSASEKLPYAIDSRFPLFQSNLPNPKPSHVLLANILGLKIGTTGRWLEGAALEETSLRSIASHWIEFNTAYTELQPKKFEKYARRLNRPMGQQEAQGPRWIFPPYLMKDDEFPGALETSQRLWDYSVEAADTKQISHLLRRVIAVKDPAELGMAAIECGQEQIVVWVSNLDELLPSNVVALTEYARSIRQIASVNATPFALYGGYFAVMLRSVGLAGASHGVGFSESRDHVELKSSGAAPARYYVMRLHRFIPRDLASELWRRRADLMDSDHAGYISRDPAELDYHDLMEHSVRARRHEIEQSAGKAPEDFVEQLRRESASFRANLESIKLTDALRKRISDLTAHLSMWATVLSSLDG